MTSLTWNDLVRLEPGLQQLLSEALSIKDDGTAASFCANRQWYRGGLRARLVSLVGWYAQSGKPDLMTCDAYLLAYETVYSALPDCRSCWCL